MDWKKKRANPLIKELFFRFAVFHVRIEPYGSFRIDGCDGVLVNEALLSFVFEHNGKIVEGDGATFNGNSIGKVHGDEHFLFSHLV